jgi:hypothetical protein
MGIIGKRFVSDFSFEVSIVLPRGNSPSPWNPGAEAHATGCCRRSTGKLERFSGP